MRTHFFKIVFIFCALCVVVLTIFLLGYAHLFGAVDSNIAETAFVITPSEPMDDISHRLHTEGLIRNEWAFRLAYATSEGVHEVRPGGYTLSSSMDVWTVVGTLAKSPYLAWVVLPPGLRKEQVGTVLANTLSWTAEEQKLWSAPTTFGGISEGTEYLPDTYLIPSDQNPTQIASRLATRFAQGTDVYAQQAIDQKKNWQMVVNIASLIEREAAGPDMKLISGIIWNRLHKNMKLQLDATLQYVKGNEQDGWWSFVKSEDKYLDSPFNTYQHTGLPPHPIAVPALAAIDAALNPTTTTCLYYLHDSHGQIHCSQDYAGQLSNVQKYLK